MSNGVKSSGSAGYGGHPKPRQITRARRQQLLSLVHDRLTMGDLVDLFQVSARTIRHDLKLIEPQPTEERMIADAVAGMHQNIRRLKAILDDPAEGEDLARLSNAYVSAARALVSMLKSVDASEEEMAEALERMDADVQ